MFLIIAGTLTKNMQVLRRLYDQMPDPKWVISMGSCCKYRRMFNTYATVQGADRIIPVDIYLQDVLQDLKLYSML